MCAEAGGGGRGNDRDGRQAASEHAELVVDAVCVQQRAAAAACVRQRT